jgi:hypothetical protein
MNPTDSEIDRAHRVTYHVKYHAQPCQPSRESPDRQSHGSLSGYDSVARRALMNIVGARNIRIAPELWTDPSRRTPLYANWRFPISAIAGHRHRTP